MKNLKFINIYDIKHYDIFMNNIDDISELVDNNIFVFQKEDIITNTNYKSFDYNI